jgi:hypothetical protein
MTITQTAGGTMFTGDSVPIFQITVLKSAIKLYRDTGMKANRAYTPTNMKRTAENLTGLTFKRGDWDTMIDALQALLPHA